MTHPNSAGLAHKWTPFCGGHVRTLGGATRAQPMKKKDTTRADTRNEFVLSFDCILLITIGHGPIQSPFLFEFLSALFLSGAPRAACPLPFGLLSSSSVRVASPSSKHRSVGRWRTEPWQKGAITRKKRGGKREKTLGVVRKTKHMDQRRHLGALPDELLAMVAAGLDAVSLGKAACACRTLARICTDPRPWRALCAASGILDAPLYAPIVRGEVAVTPDPDDRWRWLCVLAIAGDDRRFAWHGGTLGGSRERAPGLPAVRACSVHGWFDAAQRVQGFGVEAANHLSTPAEYARWYAGTWEDGLWHGHGVRNTHGTIMTCQWRRGMAHGPGKSVSVSGQCSYVGAWKGGARHGRGVTTCRISHIQCAGGWVAGRNQGWCVFSKLDDQTPSSGLCFECDFTWGTTVDWAVVGDPRVRSVGLWCRNDCDTGKRTAIEYADRSVFETPCRAPSVSYATMPTGRGVLTLADGTRLACDTWDRGSPTGTVTRTRPGSPLACAEWWSEWNLGGCDLVCCVDKTPGPVSRDTAILSKRTTYETLCICLDSPCTVDATDPAASPPWSGSRSPTNIIYYPEPRARPTILSGLCVFWPRASCPGPMPWSTMHCARWTSGLGRRTALCPRPQGAPGAPAVAKSEHRQTRLDHVSAHPHKRAHC
ncbi:Morn repeat protein [Pandoravirus inopinatum]|uniref:Morn repeat protein n=1 Tax=Pandoravirus inopinatum TaxID=1605721 RepID=A0A0B5JBC0_9VIRU|nr:Morn repeat protein [Pandoravirus inopinatum]AJF96857.1 Morn repeat protein [Pandoravirus inopinatum]